MSRMGPLARSLPLLATLGAACFQDDGPVGLGPSATSSGAESSTGTTSAATTLETTSATTTFETTSATTGLPVDPPCEAYYWTDFSADPVADWTVFSASWLWDQVGGVYRGVVMNPEGGAGAQLDAGTWKDFSLHVRLRLAPTSYGGLVLRAADQFQGDFLYIQLDSTDGDIEGFRAGSMSADFGFTGVVKPDQWTALVVRFEGTNLTLTVDDVPLANGLQVQGLAMGLVGAIVLKGAMDIDMIAVCPP